MSKAIGTVRIKTDSLERVWGLRPGGAPAQRCDPFGRPYDTLTHAGVKAEGCMFAWFADSPEVAVEAYLRELHKYIERHKPTAEVIHWRSRPALRQDDGKWVVYSRLSLSNLDDVAA